MKRPVILILIGIMLIALSGIAFACRLTTQSVNGAAATATYGAEMFHLQLTALAVTEMP